MGTLGGGRLTSHYNLLYAQIMKLFQEDWQRMSAEAQLESAQEVIKAKQRGSEKGERICFFFYFGIFTWTLKFALMYYF